MGQDHACCHYTSRERPASVKNPPRWREVGGVRTPGVSAQVMLPATGYQPVAADTRVGLPLWK